MIYRGRTVDVVGLWGEYVEFPANTPDPLPTYLDKVVCPNPDHDTHKRHFQVNAKKPWVHCFADCGISGTYEHALCVINGFYAKHKVTAEDIALAKTLRRHDEPEHVANARERVNAAHREARRIILGHTRIATKGVAISARTDGTRKTLTADSSVANDERLLRAGAFRFLPKVARNYLDLRGIDDSARGKWELGWDEETDRLVIPAYDERGTFRFLIRREVLKQTSMKYHYTDGAVRSSILFGACSIDRAQVATNGLVLCEGPLDVIHLHSIGVTNAVAILGSGISRAQVRLIDNLMPSKVYLLFDKDSAGIYNVMVAWKGREGRHRGLAKYPLRVCRYINGKEDPAELSRKEVLRVLERAVTPIKFAKIARDAEVQLTTTGG